MELPVVYLRAIDSLNQVHVSLVMSKTKVSPIKRLSIPPLELCGVQILARLLIHVKDVLQLSMSHIFAWIDSTSVLNSLSGNPRRFKTFVGNCVSSIIDEILPDRWNHVIETENPVDCASQGIFPLELSEHKLWWKGPPWLTMDSGNWPHQDITLETIKEEKKEICIVMPVQVQASVVPQNHYSSYTHL